MDAHATTPPMIIPVFQVGNVGILHKVLLELWVVSQIAMQVTTLNQCAGLHLWVRALLTCQFLLALALQSVVVFLLLNGEFAILQVIARLIVLNLHYLPTGIFHLIHAARHLAVLAKDPAILLLTFVNQQSLQIKLRLHGFLIQLVLLALN